MLGVKHWCQDEPEFAETNSSACTFNTKGLWKGQEPKHVPALLLPNMQAVQWSYW